MKALRSFIAIALAALAGMASAQESSLDAVMKDGVLRACTPGDYKPFSFQRADGAFEGLDKSVVIVDWYFDQRAKSLPFFASRGHRQILAGYYDAPVRNIRTWLDDAKAMNVPIAGVMYTTWADDYSQLEAFAKAAWGP